MLCASLVNLRIFSAIFGCNGNPHNPHTLSFHTSLSLSLSLSHSLHGPFQEFSSATDWRQASGPVAQSSRNSVHLVFTWTYLINLRPSKTYERSIWCLAVINPSSTPCQIWTWPDSAHLAIPWGKLEFDPLGSTEHWMVLRNRISSTWGTTNCRPHST